MNLVDTASERAALAILGSCLDRPPEGDLLPLLALSVLATERPFSGRRVADLAIAMANGFASANDQLAAEGVLRACATQLERCGAYEPAADLREAVALVRMKGRHRRGRTR